jgi:Mn-dependent DtxR family transcriptional regulator
MTSWVLWRMRRRRQLERLADGSWHLTARGEERARRLIRKHRLWEDYLVHEVGVRPDHVHGTAERLEHLDDPSVTRELDSATGSPERDPHDRPIPK